MSVVSAADRRLFVRDTASQLATAASVTLKRENADGLAQVCGAIVSKSQRVGAPTIAQFAQVCEKLCRAAGANLSPSLCAEGDELLKACFAAIQSSLFSMALGGTHDASPGQFERFATRVRELIDEPPPVSVEMPPAVVSTIQIEFPAPNEPLIRPEHAEALVPAEPLEAPEQRTPWHQRQAEIALQAAKAVESTAQSEPTAQPEPFPADESFSSDAWNELNQVTSTSLVAKVGDELSPSESLLAAVARLADRAQNNTEYRDMAFEIAAAARRAHSVYFKDLCGTVHTDTPRALLEEGSAKAVREQLAVWLKDSLSGSPVTASLRQVGGGLWLEVRQNGVPNGGVSGSQDRIAAALSLQESYVLNDGTWVRRVRVNMTLPTFEAYEVQSLGRAFLVPAGDVEAVLERVPAEIPCIPLHALLELPEDWKTESNKRSALVIRWRGRSSVVEVEKVSGPNTYYGRNVRDAGPDLRGLTGVAHLADGRRAGVVDLYAWLETWSERARGNTSGASGETDARKSGKYVVFRVSGRRYAVPLEKVRGVGRIDSQAFLLGMVETEQGAFHVRDLKEALGISGEAGTFYVAIESRHGVVAWVVDGVEKLFQLPPGGETVRVAPFGQGSRPSSVQGVLPGTGPTAPVFLLNPDALAPSVRMNRRIARQ